MADGSETSSSQVNFVVGVRLTTMSGNRVSVDNGHNGLLIENIKIVQCQHPVKGGQRVAFKGKGDRVADLLGIL